MGSERSGFANHFVVQGCHTSTVKSENIPVVAELRFWLSLAASCSVPTTWAMIGLSDMVSMVTSKRW
jgi:hypothetical protein